jgi:hypothetical protein
MGAGREDNTRLPFRDRVRIQKGIYSRQQHTLLCTRIMWSSPPFALFVLVEVSTDVSRLGCCINSTEYLLQQLNKILEAAFKGTEFSEHCLWLPSSDDYADAPNKVSGKATEGTKPPVSSYKSPFIGKKGEDVATWLKNKPKEADIDICFFAILDRSAEKGSMVVGRQGGRDLKDMDDLEFMRFDAEFATASLYAAQSGTWEEMKTSTGLAEIEY